MMKKIVFSMLCTLSFSVFPMHEDMARLMQEAAEYDAEVEQRGEEKPKPLKMDKAEPYYVIPPTHNNRSTCDEVCYCCVGCTAGCLADICAWLQTLSNSAEKND